MKDINIEEMIRKASVSELKADFEDVRARIEKDETETGIPFSNVRRYRTVVAAVLALLVVGAAVVIALSSGVSSDDVMYESSMESAGVMYDEEVGQSAVSPEEGEDSYSAMAQHYIERSGMTFTLPAFIPATGQSVGDDFAPLADYAVDAQTLEEHYKENNVYFNAIWTDEVQKEITVSITTDAYTYSLYHLDRATPEELEKIKSSFTVYGTQTDHEPGVAFGNVELYEHSQTLFIRAECNVNTSAAYENRMLYMTVINGQRITITLIERYPSGEDVDISSYSDKVSDGGKEILTIMLDSLEFDRVKSAFFARYRFLIGFGVIAIAGAVVLNYLLVRRKKRVEQAEAKKPTESEEDEGE